MRVEEIEEKLIYGISTRTKNSNEMDPKTAKIGAIWQKFYSTVEVNYKDGERVYGIYYNFESDANGEFDVLAGYEISNENLDKITIQKGKYLVFHKTLKETDDNARIQAVIETWGKIWKYFSNENSQYKRVYKTDFEHYKEKNEIEIYISIE
ncbi:GyrI-like domain-containing protein [Sulfurimonas sp.]|uniref:GyrI-like domain-containing protein n=1 Tax=Sulfurimonas sp. TaxID=2022749 RepID=UPI002AB0412E|nr:effector binding domain-containing protein [Sulfurimonas sp.]